MSNKQNDPWTAISMRESVKRKFDKVAAAKRWAMHVVADEAIESLARHEGIDLSEPSDHDNSNAA